MTEQAGSGDRPVRHRSDDGADDGEDVDGGMYGVFGEGRPRHIVGETDGPPRRRPRKRAAPPAEPPA